MRIDLDPRETAHAIAALRYYGRAVETLGVIRDGPHLHPLVSGRLKGHYPMTLDEIETFIGRLDGSLHGRRTLRKWNPWHYL